MKLRIGQYIRESLRDLAREAIQFAKDELVIHLRRVARDLRPLRKPAAMVAVGVVLALFSTAVLIAAAILGLAQVIPAWAAALGVGVLLGLGAMYFLSHMRHPSWGKVTVLPPETLKIERRE